MDASPNPIVQATAGATDKLFKETACASAIKAMQKYDPDFDLEDLTEEAMEIFQEFFCNFLTGNKEYLSMICGGEAGALCKA